MSAPAYFISVLLLTLAGFGAAMLARPAFGHAVLQWVGLEPAPRALPGSFYTVRVAPLFRDHCIGCHGETRQKAGLRLDSFAEVMLGSRHGAVVRPGDARHSELFTRISLPQSDDKAMPPSGKTPLTDDEVTVIRLWIAGGASPGIAASAVKGAPKLVRPVTIPELDPARVARQRAPLAAALQEVQRRLPGVIDYESRGTADLEVNASLMGPRFGDADLATLGPLATHIARADFSGTAITDASAAALAAMT
ncbi:MAG TPA: c-type cytochrome domain-containing protein, partial [Rhizomicrobium sp.]